MILSKKLDRYVAALAVAGVGVAAQSASAAIVYVPSANINIPSTTAGVYLNVVTGVFSSSPSAVPGWDVNPWSSSGLGLFNPAAPSGGVYRTTTAGGTTALNMNFGDLIGPGQNYGSNSSANNAQWNLNSSNNLVGFRFQNEANGNQIHYGWMRISLAATAGGQPRAIVEYAYESVAGVAIQAGVPTPGAASLLGVAGLAAMRRRR